ncbi:MAG: NUDIX hydrolase [Hyphomicrobiaceae bacterium]
MKPTNQIAALPTRRGLDGQLEILLVTSRETHRWVIPKGWPMRNLADHLAAAEEAWEEAGVKGLLDEKALGSFTYDKRRRSDVIALDVTVYLMKVAEVFDTWPEARERERAWFSITDAAEAIAEPELRAIILGLAEK